MRRRLKRGISFVLTACMSIGLLSNTVSNAYVVDNVVTVKTINNDVCVSTTPNSKYRVEDVKTAINMESDEAGSSARVNTTVIDATDLSNWYVHDHYDKQCYDGTTNEEKIEDCLAKTGYNRSLRPIYLNESADKAHVPDSLTIGDLIEANANGASAVTPWGYTYHLKEHIAATSSNGKAAMNFYGYSSKPYSDYLFYPASPDGTKKVHYTVDSRNVRVHSLNSAGFLFNTGIYTSNGKQCMDGYVLLFSYEMGDTEDISEQEAIAVGLKGAYIYKLTGIPCDDIHEGKKWISESTLTSFGGTLVKYVDLSNTTTYPFEEHFNISDIEMEITDTSVKVTMTEAGNAVDSSNAKSAVLFNDKNLQKTNYGGFGPIVSYQDHNCYYTSSFQFSDLQMSITSTNSVLDGLSDCDYIEKGVTEEEELTDSAKYFVLIGDNSQTAQGYLDYFNLQDDAIFLEKLKKQKIILITNLNIQTINEDINGTNYNLADYLGEDNVYQIPDDTLANMATSIKNIINQKEYNAKQAEQAADALAGVIQSDGQKTAVAQVTYKGYQVESIDALKLTATGIPLKIETRYEIGVSNPTYKLLKPNGITLNLGSDNTFQVMKNSNWPSGKYTASVTYADGTTASTTFSIGNLYSSYLNGVASSSGSETAGVQARPGDIGESTVKEGSDFVAVFPKTTVSDIPQITKVFVDVNKNGQCDAGEELTSGNYTYQKNSKEGVLTVPGSKTVGDVYIEAEQEYTVYPVRWHLPDTMKWEKLDYVYQSKQIRSSDVECNAKLLWPSYREYYAQPTIRVEVAGQELAATAYTYDADTGEFHLPKANITGAVDVYAEREFIGADVTVDKEHLSYTGPTEIQGGVDFVATLTADRGYALPREIKLQHKPFVGEEQEYVDYTTSDYSYNYRTGAIRLASDKYDGDIKIIAKGTLKKYLISHNGTHINYDGDEEGDVEHLYEGQLTPATNYVLPESIVVKRDRTAMTSGYQYDKNTGKITIAKGELYGEILIEASGVPKQYPVTTDLSNLTYTGEETGDVEHEYTAQIVAPDHYRLPNSITVKRNGRTLLTGYDYNRTTGEIVIDQGVITGDIEIVADADAIQYNIVSNMTNLDYEGAEKGDVENNYKGRVIENGEYHLPETIIVKRGGEVITSGYQYDEQTGYVTLKRGTITDDMEIIAEGVERQYAVNNHITNGGFMGDNIAKATEDYEAFIIANKGYYLPENIEVRVDGRKIVQGVSYNMATGKVEIQASNIRGDIDIYATMVAGTNEVVFDVKNIDPEGASSVKTNAEYVAKLAPIAINYVLPEKISIKVGEDELEADKDYVYNHKTGALAILQNVINDKVTIKAEATKIVLKEEQKIPQPAPKEEDLTIIPPTYENTKDGKIIGVSLDMEYSLDGGKTWLPCKSSKITKLGVGTVMLRMKGDETKQKGAIVSIEMDSETSEYYIPTISMSKKLGCKKKFQILLLNTTDAVLKIESTNPKVATVNKKGIIKTKKKEGKTKIVITILKGKHIVQYVTHLTVKKKIKKNYSLVKFDTKYKGPTIALYKLVYRGTKWKVNMTHTKGSKITYKSSNKKVATVSKNGTVKGLKTGATTITINVENDKVADRYSVVVRVNPKGVKAKQPKYLKIIK